MGHAFQSDRMAVGGDIRADTDGSRKASMRLGQHQTGTNSDKNERSTGSCCHSNRHSACEAGSEVGEPASALELAQSDFIEILHCTLPVRDERRGRKPR